MRGEECEQYGAKYERRRVSPAPSSSIAAFLAASSEFPPPPPPIIRDGMGWAFIVAKKGTVGCVWCEGRWGEGWGESGVR